MKVKLFASRSQLDCFSLTLTTVRTQWGQDYKEMSITNNKDTENGGNFSF